MNDYFFRTEDIKIEEVLDYFVETQRDREIVNALKARNPVVLVGSRGVGKSFLLRVAQAELLKEFPTEKVLPVYVSFAKSTLLQTLSDEHFVIWMLSKISAGIVRSLSRAGLIFSAPNSLRGLTGSASPELQKTELEKLVDQYENVWKGADVPKPALHGSDVEGLKQLIEDLCGDLGIKRLTIFVDEAAHVFLPRQQRLFFTLFRDLRSPYLSAKAAVYPGVTSFGETFQPLHDGAIVQIDRDVTSKDYVRYMREIVEKQAESSVIQKIEVNGGNFSVLAYAATGNPRLLLKTLARTQKLNSAEVNQVIRDYYRTDAWSEHSLLVDRYSGHKALIDWGRTFIENKVLPDLKNRNDQNTIDGPGTSAWFWVHRDSPEFVKQALKILTYTGIVVEVAIGAKAGRGDIGTRYMVNIGCLLSLESGPVATGSQLTSALTPRRTIEYSRNNLAFSGLEAEQPTLEKDGIGLATLNEQLARDVNVLDLTAWQIQTLHDIGLSKISDVLKATEQDLQKAKYVGEVRSRRMRNAAFAAIYEYLSG